jgi:hypothetical protein
MYGKKPKVVGLLQKTIIVVMPGNQKTEKKWIGLSFFGFF